MSILRWYVGHSLYYQILLGKAKNEIKSRPLRQDNSFLYLNVDLNDIHRQIQGNLFFFFS